MDANGGYKPANRRGCQHLAGCFPIFLKYPDSEVWLLLKWWETSHIEGEKPWINIGVGWSRSTSRAFSFAKRNHRQLTVRPCTTNIRRLFDKFIPSRFCVNLEPNVKLCKVLGKLTPSSFWLNSSPNFRLCSVLGKVTPSSFWLNSFPNVKLRRLLGKVTCSRLRLNS